MMYQYVDSPTFLPSASPAQPLSAKSHLRRDTTSDSGRDASSSHSLIIVSMGVMPAVMPPATDCRQTSPRPYSCSYLHYQAYLATSP